MLERSHPALLFNMSNALIPTDKIENLYRQNSPISPSYNLSDMHSIFPPSLFLLGLGPLISAAGVCTNVCSSATQKPGCFPQYMGANDFSATNAAVQCFPNGASKIQMDDGSQVLTKAHDAGTLGIKNFDGVEYILVSRSGNFYQSTLSDGNTAALTIQNNYGCDTWVSYTTVVKYFQAIGHGCDNRGLRSGGYLDTVDKKFRCVLQAI